MAANPITWRNVAAPNHSGSLAAFDRASKTMSQGIAGIGEAVVDYSDDRTERDTADFVAYLQSLPDDASRRDAVANASEATRAFMDAGAVNDSVNDAQLRDFAVAEEERDVVRANQEAQTHGLNVREAEERIRSAVVLNPLKEAKQKEANEEQKLVNEQAAKLRPGALEAQRLTNAATATQRLASQARIQTELQLLKESKSNIATDVKRREKLEKELAAIDKKVANDKWTTDTLTALPGPTDPERNNKLSTAIASGIARGADVTELKRLRKEAIATTDVDAATFAVQAGLQSNVSDGVTSYSNFSPASRKKLEKLIAGKIRGDFGNASETELLARAGQIIDSDPRFASGFATAKEQAGWTIKQKAKYAKTQDAQKFASTLANSTNIGADYPDAVKQLLSGDTPATPQDLALLDRFRPAAIANHTIDFSTSDVFDDTAGDNLVKTKISADDVASMQKNFREQMAVDYPAATAAEKAQIFVQSVENHPGLSQALATSKAGRELAASLTAAVQSAEATRLKNKIELETSAIKKTDAFLVEVDKGPGSAVAALVKDAVEFHDATAETSPVWLVGDDGKIDREVLKSTVITTMAKLRDRFGSTKSEGDIALMMRGMLQGSTVLTTGNNELAVLDQYGEFQEIVDLDNWWLEDLASKQVSTGPAKDISGAAAKYASPGEAEKKAKTANEITRLKTTLRNLRKSGGGGQAAGVLQQRLIKLQNKATK
jgi:hypothetical protein